MLVTTILPILAATVPALAQRPSDTPICDYYTTALLKNNTGENQYTLLTLLVNTAVIGNYTQPNVGVSVPGILAKGTYNGTEVNLLPYFDGELASTNRGGNQGVAVNFLDGGGATPLMMNMPSNSTSANQYFLLTHLYSYFGYLLGCSKYSMPGFPAYSGHASMYDAHKFMALDSAEVGYFVQQVGLAAASFGVANDDIQIVAKALNELFGYRCAPAATVIPAQGAVLESICITDDCPIAANSTCSSYSAVVVPSAATASTTLNGTSTGNSTTASNGTISASATATMPAAFTGAAGKFGVEISMVLLALGAVAVGL